MRNLMGTESVSRLGRLLLAAMMSCCLLLLLSGCPKSAAGGDEETIEVGDQNMEQEYQNLEQSGEAGYAQPDTGGDGTQEYDYSSGGE